MDKRPKCVFCDIDGTLVEHSPPSQSSRSDHRLKLLDGTIDKLLEWDKNGYYIILTTGRKESLRTVTEKQLSDVGIFYDQLIMGIGGGERVLINDKKPDGRESASCINLIRDKGIKEISI